MNQMWSSRTTELSHQRGLRFDMQFESRPATYRDVLRGWREDADFRSMFNSLLAAVPYSAFRWETPSVTSTTVSRPFECVVLNDPSLERRQDAAAFSEHFDDARDGVAVFANLGRDAIMVVPTPLVGSLEYGHLAAFARSAPDFQRDALWRTVGEAMTSRVGNRPVWLSTAGAGVSWLHVRLDDRPKYYDFEPYR